MDYILVSDCRIFNNVSVQDLRHNYDHLMVMGYLRGASLREQLRYLGSRTFFLLRLPGQQTRAQVDKIFAELRSGVLNADKQVSCHNSWISAEMQRLVDERVSVRQ